MKYSSNLYLEEKMGVYFEEERRSHNSSQTVSKIVKYKYETDRNRCFIEERIH